eukprot:2965501-Rhodomonas_salina.1
MAGNLTCKPRESRPRLFSAHQETPVTIHGRRPHLNLLEMLHADRRHEIELERRQARRTGSRNGAGRRDITPASPEYLWLREAVFGQTSWPVHHTSCAHLIPSPRAQPRSLIALGTDKCEDCSGVRRARGTAGCRLIRSTGDGEAGRSTA